MSRTNRITVARAFSRVPRVDLSIDCVLEDQMGRVYVENPAAPRAFQLRLGPFNYFAGDPQAPGSCGMVASLEPYAMLFPSADGWAELAKDVHGARLVEIPRYSFSSRQLRMEHLETMLRASEWCDKLVRVDSALATHLYRIPGHWFDLSDYESGEDFVARGLGYCLFEAGMPAAGGYSSLVCSRGIEVSIYVEPPYRRRGVAAALACALLIECLRAGMEPHWDAANVESCRLAEKLGYTATGEYRAWYVRPSD